MENTSKVWFTNMRTNFGDSLPNKLTRLIKAAGIASIDFNHQFVAIKMHFGEKGNLAFLRPNFAKTVVDTVKHLGGKPFLTDCSTLYPGTRKNALEHLDTAWENGFNPLSAGCNILIADGLTGLNETLVPVAGEYIQTAKIGAAIMDADIVISLNHFKGHEMTGFGGAIKNIGMGCASRAGKMDQHIAGKPSVDPDLCIGCGKCRRNCAHDAITLVNKKAIVDHTRCVGCGRCIGSCPTDAMHPGDGSSSSDLSCKMAEYALAVVSGRPHFHISIVIDVSPNCDCHGENDMPIVPNVGMFASFDPVALDQACADAVNRQPSITGSQLGEQPDAQGDHFCSVHPSTDWHVCLAHAEKIGLGRTAYQLISVK